MQRIDDRWLIDIYTAQQKGVDILRPPFPSSAVNQNSV